MIEEFRELAFAMIVISLAWLALGFVIGVRWGDVILLRFA